jgi:hypothetical protein
MENHIVNFSSKLMTDIFDAMKNNGIDLNDGDAVFKCSMLVQANVLAMLAHDGTIPTDDIERLSTWSHERTPAITNSFIEMMKKGTWR